MNSLASPSSDGEERQQPRKRQRTSNGNGEDKKARGRPRLAPQDETAAERRRTQIRLAQRAYRQRKETTISALKKQVSELQDIIGDMNKSFLRFNDMVLDVGVSPGIAKELKSLTHQFILYAKAQGNSDDEQESGLVDSDEIVHNLATEPAPPRKFRRSRSGSRASSQDYYTEDIGMGYRSVYDLSSIPIDENTAFPDDISPKSSDHDMPGTKDFTEVRTSPKKSSQAPQRSVGSVVVPVQDENQQQYFNTNANNGVVQSYYSRIPDQVMPVAAINELEKSTNLNNKPFVYSFQETTFARRLQRAAVECGYHLIAQAHLRPKVFKRVFKLSLLYGSREQIAARFRSLLTKSTSESLEFWQTPMIRLGGAGTHYPRFNDDGTLYNTPNTYNVHQVAPDSNLIQLKHVDDGKVYCDMLIDISGYEGEWFDPGDVEGYLASKGIYIDPQSSFADCQISESELPELSRSPLRSEATSSSSNPTTPLWHGNTQQQAADTVSSYLSTSFFDDLVQKHMKSMPAEPQQPFGENFDPVTFTDEAFDALSKPLSTSHQSLATTNTPSYPSSRTSVMAPNSLIDHSIDTLFDFFLPNPFPLEPGTDMHTDFDVVDFDNLPLEEQNNWGFSSAGAADENTAGLVEAGSVAMSGANEGVGEGKDSNLEKKTVTIDVTRMIEELLKGAVCLGRSPGFRKKDVSRAIELAMITAF